MHWHCVVIVVVEVVVVRKSRPPQLCQLAVLISHPALVLRVATTLTGVGLLVALLCFWPPALFCLLCHSSRSESSSVMDASHPALNRRFAACDAVVFALGGGPLSVGTPSDICEVCFCSHFARWELMMVGCAATRARFGRRSRHSSVVQYYLSVSHGTEYRTNYVPRVTDK